MSYRTPGSFSLSCDMAKECTETVTHIDDKGYVYCKKHGLERRSVRRCRQLRSAELKKLLKGQPLARY